MKKTLTLAAVILAATVSTTASADCTSDIVSQAVVTPGSEVLLISGPGKDADKLAYLHVDVDTKLHGGKSTMIVTHTPEGKAKAAENGFDGKPLLVLKKDGATVMKCTQELK